MKIVLISTYELGRQPFGLASAAAWLRKRGDDVVCLDLSRQELDEGAVRRAELIAFFVPMHTAARLTLPLIQPLRELNPKAHFCIYGLYASLAEESFRKEGVKYFCAGEFEQGLIELAERIQSEKKAGHDGERSQVISVARQEFKVPDRSDLPALKQYAHIVMPGGEHRTAGYTEASRGCKHVCRHCPIVPVYKGIFRIVDREVVLADIRQQVAAGARHITFGDPDFFNGIGHALAIVREMHREFPQVTYDATIKVEHLRKHEKHLATLRETGCLLVTSAVESLDDEVLLKLDKGHTRADFLHVAETCREAGLTLQPTFVPFTPWTTLESYEDLLATLRKLELWDAVAPIQLAIRLLVPATSRLLELDDIQRVVEPFDEALLVYPWRHSDPRVDALAEEVQEIAAASEKMKRSRQATFQRIQRAASEALGAAEPPDETSIVPRRTPPAYLNEPWYC